MSFSKYLLKNKLITEVQFLEALSFQIENTPSFLSFVINHAGIDKVKLSDLYSDALDNGISPVKLLKDHNILNENDIINIQNNQFEKGYSFSDSLVELEIMTVDSVEKSILEYRDKNPQIKSKVSTFEENNSSNDNNIDISAAALESLKELGDFDSLEIEKLEGQVDRSSTEDNDLLDEVSSQINNQDNKVTEIISNKLEDVFVVKDDSTEDNVSGENTVNSEFNNEFIKTFNENKLSKINKILNTIKTSLQNESEATSNYLNSLYKEVHLIKGVGSLADIKIVVKTTNLIEETLEDLFKKDESEVKSTLKNLIDDFFNLFESLWEVRNMVEQKECVNTFSSNLDLKDNLVNTFKKFKGHQKALAS